MPKCPMWNMRSPRGSARWCRSCTRCLSWCFFYHDGDNIYVCFWAIGEVMGVIEMVVDKQDDRDVHNVGKVVTKEWRNWHLYSF